MHLFEFIVAVVAISSGAGVIKSYIRYKQSAFEAKLQRAAEPDSALRAEVAELRQRMSELRDVTTQYDMSFDTALHRMESRLATVESRLQAVENMPNTLQASR